MTNPTGLERAECSLKVEGIRPQRFVCHDDRWHYGDNACYRATRAEAANPTERPEERDSLEDRVARWEEMATDWRNNNAPGLKHQLGVAAETLRTLINEVKERDDEIAKLRTWLFTLQPDWEEKVGRARSGEGPRLSVEDVRKRRDEGNASLSALEAEVKELREENRKRRIALHETEGYWRECQDRIKQMEEALREAHGILQYNLGDVDPHVRPAFSSSDTEEEA